MKYEGPKSYQSKNMANVKVFVDKPTDAWTNRLKGWPKIYMPPIYRCRGHKKEKILVTSIFSTFCNVFKKIFIQKSGLCRKGLICCLQNAFNLVKSKYLSFGKGLSPLFAMHGSNVCTVCTRGN